MAVEPKFRHSSSVVPGSQGMKAMEVEVGLCLVHTHYFPSSVRVVESWVILLYSSPSFFFGGWGA